MDIKERIAFHFEQLELSNMPRYCTFSEDNNPYIKCIRCTLTKLLYYITRSAYIDNITLQKAKYLHLTNGEAEELYQQQYRVCLARHKYQQSLAEEIEQKNEQPERLDHLRYVIYYSTESADRDATHLIGSREALWNGKQWLYKGDPLPEGAVVYKWHQATN